MNKLILKVFILIVPLLATVPAVAQFDNAFQSTSSMAGSGSAYASDPSINSYGQATYSTYGSSRGRTLTPSGGGGGESSETETDPNNPGDPGLTPIGSAVPALLLLAGVYAGVVAVHRRRQQV